MKKKDKHQRLRRLFCGITHYRFESVTVNEQYRIYACDGYAFHTHDGRRITIHIDPEREIVLGVSATVPDFPEWSLSDDEFDRFCTVVAYASEVPAGGTVRRMRSLLAFGRDLPADQVTDDTPNSEQTDDRPRIYRHRRSAALRVPNGRAVRRSLGVHSRYTVRRRKPHRPSSRQ